METKEDREKRLLALEEEHLLTTLDQTDFDKLVANSQWVEAVDELVDNIKVNCKPKDMKEKEHKHLKKLITLEDRIARWKQVGPAVTEHEWEMANDDLDWVTEWRRNCSKDANLRIPKAFLIRMNKIWKKYATKADTLIDKLKFSSRKHG